MAGKPHKTTTEVLDVIRENTTSDCEIARQYGLSYSTVAYWRKKFLLPEVPQIHLPIDTKEAVLRDIKARLWNDAEIAARNGVSRPMVTVTRQSLGVPRLGAGTKTRDKKVRAYEDAASFIESANLSSQSHDVLSQFREHPELTDKQIGDHFGLSRQRVHQLRTGYGLRTAQNRCGQKR